MSTTVADLITSVDLIIRDSSTDSVTEANRLDAITEAVRQMYSDFEFDFTNMEYEFDYFDTINEYDITSNVPDFLEPVDVVRIDGLHQKSFTRKSAREIKEEIDNGFVDESFAIEVKDRKNFVWVNHNSRYSATTLHDCEDTDSNGTWAVDSSTSDATNLTKDTAEKKSGSASLNFDADVSQSVNNRATIENPDMSSVDLSEQEDLGSFIVWIYVPDVTEFSSLTVYWGSSSSAYWSGTATTDINGASFVDGWNRVKVDWSATTKTGSPDASAIDYLRLDFNYTASQGDDTDFRFDQILMVRPEKLKFLYQSWAIGVTSTSDNTLVYDFTATTNVPLYSGIYDYVNVYVAHLASAILFRATGEIEDSNNEEAIAARELQRLKRKFPSSRITETRNFKVQGLNWK